MPLIDALNRVLKYGRAPEDMIRMGASAAGEENGLVHPDNLEDARFQDMLEDHDDPRHLIVRKNREQSRSRSEGGKDWLDTRDEMLGEGVIRPHLVETYAVPDGELHFSHYRNQAGDRHAVVADWFVMEPQAPNTIRNYGATITKEEVEHIKANLPDLKKLG